MFDELVGQTFIFSSVTYFTVGRVRKVSRTGPGAWVILDCASWVAETGKLSHSLSNGSFDESEFLGDGVWINLDTCTDLLPWAHELPKSSK